MMDITAILHMHAELSLTAVFILMFLLDLFLPAPQRHWLRPMACILLTIQLLANLWPEEVTLFGGMYHSTPMASVLKSILTIGTILVFLQADPWLKREDTRHKQGEFYILTLSTLLGMYFMVSAGAQLILDECTAKGCNLHDLADYAVIQINDTHPTMVIPELIRLLVERGLDMDEAIEVVSKTCAYTNHTILAEALEKYQLRETEPMRILCSVGGLDIAGLCGVFLGGAKYHMPIVADGVISAVAALTAERLCPGTKEFIIPSHKGKEPASELLMRELGLSPVLDAELALGEGTGAVMMFSLLDIAMSLYETGATFGDFKIEEYHRF